MVNRIHDTKLAREMNPIVVSPPRDHLWGMAGMKPSSDVSLPKNPAGTWLVSSRVPEGKSRSTLVPDPHRGGTETQPSIGRLSGSDRVLLQVSRGGLQKYQRATQGMKPEHDFWLIVSGVVDAYENIPSTLPLPSGDVLDFSKGPRLMGVLNVTPDSFSDGGKHVEPSVAIDRAKEMEAAGAALIDVGGESTRPGAEPVSVEEELDRILPVIEELHENLSIPISVDSRKPDVVKEALESGASVVNDVGGLHREPEIAEIAADFEVPVVAMHMQGEPETMQDKPEYQEGPVTDIIKFLRRSISVATEKGLSADRVIIDPGIGFGKTQEHNIEILTQIHRFKSLGSNILLGTSRKSFIGNILDLPPQERVEGTAASLAFPALSGVSLFRVHDVKEMNRFLNVLWGIHGIEKP